MRISKRNCRIEGRLSANKVGTVDPITVKLWACRTLPNLRCLPTCSKGSDNCVHCRRANRFSILANPIVVRVDGGIAHVDPKSVPNNVSIEIVDLDACDSSPRKRGKRCRGVHELLSEELRRRWFRSVNGTQRLKPAADRNAKRHG